MFNHININVLIYIKKKISQMSKLWYTMWLELVESILKEEALEEWRFYYN